MRNVGLYQLGIFLHAKGKTHPSLAQLLKQNKNNGGEGSGEHNGLRESRGSTDFKQGLIRVL